MNAKAMDFVSKLGMSDIKGTSTINEIVSRLHRGGSKRRGRRKRRQSRKNRVNKKYVWPFW